MRGREGGRRREVHEHDGAKDKKLSNNAVNVVQGEQGWQLWWAEKSVYGECAQERGVRADTVPACAPFGQGVSSRGGTRLGLGDRRGGRGKKVSRQDGTTLRLGGRGTLSGLVSLRSACDAGGAGRSVTGWWRMTWQKAVKSLGAKPVCELSTCVNGGAGS